MESLFYLVNHSINTLVLSISIIMSLNDKVKVLWKTKCTWRDHAHWPKRREIKLLNQDDTLLPLKPGNAVKIKFGSRWYDAEVAEHWKPKSKKGTHLYNYTVTFLCVLEWSLVLMVMLVYTLGTTANKSSPIITELPVQVPSPVPSSVPDESIWKVLVRSGGKKTWMEGPTCCQESQNRQHHHRNDRKQQRQTEPGPGPGQLVT